MSQVDSDWVTNVETTHYVIGSVVGPHPFPWLVKELQRVIGEEARAQVLERAGALPDVVCACVGGGSNAIGIFSGFVGIEGVRLVGVEPAGHGIESGEHGASVSAGTDGVLHGARTRILQEPDGLITPAHSVSAGLDYPGSGPEHAYLSARGLATYVSVTDEVALEGFRAFSELEGIVPALEAAHVIGWLLHDETVRGRRVLVMLSGRGDKDAETVRKLLG
jgi:tryptophan synthase beta chain